MGDERSRGPFRWWHGVLFFVGVQVAGWGIRVAARRLAGNSGKQVDRDFYRKQKLPVFAPPGLAFPIAWSVNSASSIAGLLRVLNLQRRCKERRWFLGLQGAAWLLFTVFNTAYFELRSPMNAAVVTFLYSGVTAASIRWAIRMKDWGAVVSLLPTAAWLALANPVAVTVAAWNHDEFWNVGPLADPPRFLLK